MFPISPGFSFGSFLPAPNPMKPLIDVHSHLGQFTNAGMSAGGTRLCELYRQAGITHGVAFSIEACYGGLDAGNRRALEEAAPHEMISVMMVAHPKHPAASRAWIAEARSNARIVGVKLHPVLGQYDILSSSMHKLLEEVIAPSGLPVLSHVGNESPNVPIDRYLQLALKFPSVRFIAAHLGVGLMGLPDAAIDAWRRYPRAKRLVRYGHAAGFLYWRGGGAFGRGR
jgi:predicted TIM-barrel fold metal-dependent hydrolase